MARENPSWGQERIANELLVKLGLRVSSRTIRRYLPKFPIAPGAYSLERLQLRRAKSSDEERNDREFPDSSSTKCWTELSIAQNPKAIGAHPAPQRWGEDSRRSLLLETWIVGSDALAVGVGLPHDRFFPFRRPLGILTCQVPAGGILTISKSRQFISCTMRRLRSGSA
jgi:hypothetical protein